jgi:hypothetical protein
MQVRLSKHNVKLLKEYRQLAQPIEGSLPWLNLSDTLIVNTILGMALDGKIKAIQKDKCT